MPLVGNVNAYSKRIDDEHIETLTSRERAILDISWKSIQVEPWVKQDGNLGLSKMGWDGFGVVFGTLAFGFVSFAPSSFEVSLLTTSYTISLRVLVVMAWQPITYTY